MKAAMADKEASKKAVDRGKEIAEIYNSRDKTGAAALNAITNNDYSKLSAAQMKSGTFGVSVTEDEAKALGYTVEELEAEMKAAQEAAQTAWNNSLVAHTSGASSAMAAIAGSSNESLRNISSGVV
jgi:hypothetical protein